MATVSSPTVTLATRLKLTHYRLLAAAVGLWLGRRSGVLTDLLCVLGANREHPAQDLFGVVVGQIALVGWLLGHGSRVNQSPPVDALRRGADGKFQAVTRYPR